MIAVLGGAVVMVGAVLLYLASPNQQLIGTSLRRSLLGWVGMAALAIGLALILQWAGPAASAFIAMTLAMLAWTVVPPAVAWWRGAPEDKR